MVWLVSVTIFLFMGTFSTTLLVLTTDVMFFGNLTLRFLKSKTGPKRWILHPLKPIQWGTRSKKSRPLPYYYYRNILVPLLVYSSICPFVNCNCLVTSLISLVTTKCQNTVLSETDHPNYLSLKQLSRITPSIFTVFKSRSSGAQRRHQTPLSRKRCNSITSSPTCVR